MGNRAVITTSKSLDVSKANDLGIYLHWNGGRDSVVAFLKYCELKGYRPPSVDNYGWARLCQVIGNFFGGTNSIGLDTCNKLDCDNWDNGVYIIDKWEIVGRQFFEGHEQDCYQLNEMLLAIDEKQPEKDQLGADFLNAETVNTTDLQIGDKVFLFDYLEGRYELHTVMGWEDGKPYVDLYECDGDYTTNPNNYIREETIRKAN